MEYTELVLKAVSFVDPSFVERIHVQQILEDYLQHGKILSENEAAEIVESMMPRNKELCDKWKKHTLLEPRAFLYHADIAEIFIQSELAFAARYYCQRIEFNESTSAIIGRLNSKTVNLVPILKQMRIAYSPFSGRRRKTLYVGLDVNHKVAYVQIAGLTEWDQSEWDKIRPCTRLNWKQMEWLRANSKLETREATINRAQNKSDGLEDDNCFLELITCSKSNMSPYWLLEGIHNTLLKFRHPFIRITKANGEQFSIGFGRRNRVRKDRLTSCGGFMMPDEWEVAKVSLRVVTPIAISPEQCKQILKVVEAYQRKRVKFHLMDHNCANFVQMLFRLLFGPKAPNFTVTPIEAGVLCQPHEIKRFEDGFCTGTRLFRTALSECTPPIISQLAKLGGSAIQLALGHFIRDIVEEKDAQLIDEVPFAQSQCEEEFQANSKREKELSRAIKTILGEEEEGSISSSLGELSKDFENMSLKFSLPSKVTEWQLAQLGTRVYEGSDITFTDQYK